MTAKTTVKKKATKKTVTKKTVSDTPCEPEPLSEVVEETTTTMKTEEQTELLVKETELIVKEDPILASLGSLMQKMDTLEKEARQSKYEIKKVMKSVEKKFKSKKRKVDPNREPSGFAKPALLSDELCKFLKLDKGSKMARTEVTQKVNEYIKTHNLQNQDNKKKISPDKVLSNLLKVTDKDDLTYFSMQKYLKEHFPKEDTTVVV
tara:strand:+ start:2237 stop:2854 length:618 start_codon:yes stop_codon:yes gene_type:complete